jgi:outer membrane protein
MKKMILGLMVAMFAVSVKAADGGKIGYVDVQKAIQSTTAGKKAKENLDAEFGKRKKELDKKKADIEKMQQDLEKKKTVLSEEVMNKKQMELQEEMMKFQKTVAENQLELQKKEKELLEPIVDKMRKVIEKVAVDKGFSIVLDKQAQAILYMQKDGDVTDTVIAAFEKEK